MKIRKITAMLLTLCMIVTMFASVTVTGVAAKDVAPKFSDVEGKPYETSVEVLTSLGLIAGYEDGTFGGEKTVTRAEMAGFIVRELGLSSAAASSAGKTKYSDVPADHWASGYINVATTRGIIVGMGDGTFRPDEKVTYEQAVKMLVCALGYQVVAERNGGWPSGYLIQGSVIGLTDGISDIAGSDACSRGIVAELMFNSLEINLMEEVSFSGAGVQVEETTKTILYDYLKSVRLFNAEIVATATQGTSKTSKGEAKISGQYERRGETKSVSNLTVSVGETDPDLFFGSAVEIYYRENSGNTKPTMLCIIDDVVTSATLDIKVSDLYGSGFVLFPGESGFGETNNSKYARIYYKTEDSSKVQYANLLDSGKYGEFCSISVNGSVEEVADWATLKALKNGKIRLVDAKTFDAGELKTYPGGDGVYEKVIVSTYNDYVVEDIDYEGFEITTTSDVTFTLSEDNKVFKIRDAEGKEIAFEDIQVNDVLSVYADIIDAEKIDDAEILNIVVCDETVEGTVTEITSKYVYIDGTKYSVAGELSLSDFSLDDKGTFYLNADGEIVYTDSTSVANDYAVFYDVYQDSSRKISFSAVTTDGKYKDFYATSAVEIITYGTEGGVYGKVSQKKYDFTAGETADALKVLATQQDGGYKPYIATFSLKKGTDSQIETIYLAGDTEGASSFKTRFGLWAEDISAYYNKSESSLGGYSVNGETVIFDIPVSVRSSSDADKIKVYGVSGLKNNTTYSGVSVYEVDKDMTAKTILIKSTGSDVDVNSPISVIQSVTSAKNADGDSVYKVYMIQNGKVISKLTDSRELFDNFGTGTTADGYTKYSLDIAYGFYPGAVMLYSEDSTGSIENLIKIYPTTSETGTEYDEVPYYRSDFFTNWNNSSHQGGFNQGCELFIVYGQVTAKNTSTKTITVKTNSRNSAGDSWTPVTVSANYSTANVTVVDYDFEAEEDRVSIGSASDIKKDSYVLIRKQGGSTKDIVIYRESFRPDEYIG